MHQIPHTFNTAHTYTDTDPGENMDTDTDTNLTNTHRSVYNINDFTCT